MRLRLLTSEQRRDTVDRRYNVHLALPRQPDGVEFSSVRGRFSFKRIVLVATLVLCGCSTPLPFEGEPMPPEQVTAFMKVATPASKYDTPPKFLRGFAPFFPQAAEREGHWGYAELDFVVGNDGSTSDIRLVRATAYDFAQEAAVAVRKWKFSPATKNGRPVAVRVRLPFTFRS
jgi:TonB family protein